MKKLLFTIIFALVVSRTVYSDLNYEPLGKTYAFEDHVLTVSNNGFLQEIYLCKPTAGECKLIDKAIRVHLCSALIFFIFLTHPHLKIHQEKSPYHFCFLYLWY